MKCWKSILKIAKLEAKLSQYYWCGKSSRAADLARENGPLVIWHVDNKHSNVFDISQQSLICIATQTRHSHSDSRGSLHQRQTKLQNATTDRVKAKATHEGRRMQNVGLACIQIGPGPAAAYTMTELGCVARSSQNAGLWPTNWPCPALGLQLTGDHYVGKPSALGQPTRPTQPLTLPGSIND